MISHTLTLYWTCAGTDFSKSAFLVFSKPYLRTVTEETIKDVHSTGVGHDTKYTEEAHKQQKQLIWKSLSGETMPCKVDTQGELYLQWSIMHCLKSLLRVKKRQANTCTWQLHVQQKVKNSSMVPRWVSLDQTCSSLLEDFVLVAGGFYSAATF